MASAKDFARFPLLPTELRLKIWHYAANTHSLTITCKPFDLETRLFTYISSPIPLLSVNSEARQEALKCYTKISSSYFQGPCYFNPNRDIVDMTHMVFQGLGGYTRVQVVATFGLGSNYVAELDGERRVCTGEEMLKRTPTAVLQGGWWGRLRQG